MPESVIEPVLQARSATMKKHSELIKLLVGNNSTDAAQARTPAAGVGCSSASNNETTTSSASNSTPSSSFEQLTTCGSSTSQSDSVSWDTDSSRSPMSLQGQAVSPLSYSSDSADSKSPNFPQGSHSPVTSSSNNDSMLQIGWLTSSQNHSMQDLRGEVFDPSACYQAGVDQNSGVQSLLDSDPISSPANLVPPAASPAYSVLLSNVSSQPQQSAMSPGQFLDQASPLSSNYGSVISGTSSSSNDIMAVSDVSSPPTVFSPEVGAVPADDDSIPLSAFSIPFQNSQTSTFVPQASTLNDFNPQIPSIFNFSITHPHLGTSSNLSDNSALESQPEVLDSCNPFILSRGDFFAHQSLDGTRSDIGDAIVPVSESEHCDNMNIDSSLSDSHPSANVSTIQDTQSARSYRSPRDQLPLLESQRNNSTICSSNAEIQDILQQFF